MSALFSPLSFPFLPCLFLSAFILRGKMRSPVRRRVSPLNTLLSLRSLLIQTSSQRNGVQFISDWTDTADNPGTSISNCQLKTNYLLSRILSFTDYLLLKLNAIWLLRVFCLSDSTGLCKKTMGAVSGMFEVLRTECTGPASSSSFGGKAWAFPNLFATPLYSKLYCQ